MNDTAIGIVFDGEARQILTVKRKDVPVWVLPGGGVDPGESPENAAIREVLEETGLQVEILRKVARYHPINRLGRITHVYECRPIGGSLSLSDETRDIGFFSCDKLPKKFFDVHKDWLLDALAGHPDVIEEPLRSTSYWNAFVYVLKHPLVSLRFISSYRFWRNFFRIERAN